MGGSGLDWKSSIQLSGNEHTPIGGISVYNSEKLTALEEIGGSLLGACVAVTLDKAS